jgi:hypothetical protein
MLTAGACTVGASADFGGAGVGAGDSDDFPHPVNATPTMPHKMVRRKMLIDLDMTLTLLPFLILPDSPAVGAGV